MNEAAAPSPRHSSRIAASGSGKRGMPKLLTTASKLSEENGSASALASSKRSPG
jgi:hypothetical protein